MNKDHIKKLIQAEEKLGLKFPAQLFDFISTLDKTEFLFGKEEWLFWSLEDKPDDLRNFVIESSLDFKNEWSLDGLVFATNGIGDYLVVIPEKFGEQILVMMHETAELKLFATTIQEAIEDGPEDYFWTDDFIFKLDDGKLVESELNTSAVESTDDEAEDFLDEDDKLRSHLDDLIDDQKTEKTSDIISGLQKLIDGNDENNKIWALNKLSDIYLKGFGPIPKNMSTALDYNQRAIDLNSHKALSNRAACYFFGFGLDKDVEKAYEFATKANELSKANMFADILAKKEGGGMYDNLVDMIHKELTKMKKNG